MALLLHHPVALLLATTTTTTTATFCVCVVGMVVRTKPCAKEQHAIRNAATVFFQCGDFVVAHILQALLAFARSCCLCIVRHYHTLQETLHLLQTENKRLRRQARITSSSGIIFSGKNCRDEPEAKAAPSKIGSTRSFS
jgi:heme exporter protein D